VQQLLARHLRPGDHPAGEPVFDPRQALEACLGDRAMLERLLEAFLARLADQLPAIRKAIGQGDAQTVHQEAHAVKGAALNLHAAELAERAAAVEEAGKAGRLEEVAALLPALEAAARRFREQMPAG
jgi:HPt (histidine-containing phosphotransfer) domain-containing protein